MTAVLLVEGGSAEAVALDSGQAAALAASGFVDVLASPVAGMWRLRARQTVGAARIAGVELRVRPKVPVAHLMFMLGYARDPRGWRPEVVGFTQSPDLVPALAQALWRQTEHALRAGVLQGYRSVEETSPVLRGRIRETDQLRRWHGLPLPLEVRYDEYTIDIAENQILAGAIARMLRVPGVDAHSQRMLRHLAARLDGVSMPPRGMPVPAWQPSRLNARYHVALRLAEIVLTNGSIDHRVGDVRANGFMVDMWRVFEDFLCVALGCQLRIRHGGVVQTPRVDHLDEHRSIEMKPDLVWQRGEEIQAVVDAKYKARTPGSDLYQMLAYCTVYGLRHGHLVYVRGDQPPRRHVIRRAGIEVICHSLNLDQPPEQLLAEVYALADLIAEHASSKPQGSTVAAGTP